MKTDEKHCKNNETPMKIDETQCKIGFHQFSLFFIVFAMSFISFHYFDMPQDMATLTFSRPVGCGLEQPAELKGFIIFKFIIINVCLRLYYYALLMSML